MSMKYNNWDIYGVQISYNEENSTYTIYVLFPDRGMTPVGQYFDTMMEALDYVLPDIEIKEG